MTDTYITKTGRLATLVINKYENNISLTSTEKYNLNKWVDCEYKDPKYKNFFEMIDDLKESVNYFEQKYNVKYAIKEYDDKYDIPVGFKYGFNYKITVDENEVDTSYRKPQTQEEILGDYEYIKIIAAELKNYETVI